MRHCNTNQGIKRISNNDKEDMVFTTFRNNDKKDMVFITLEQHPDYKGCDEVHDICGSVTNNEGILSM